MGMKKAIRRWPSNGPAHAKHQPDAFNQREQAVNQRAGGDPETFTSLILPI